MCVRTGENPSQTAFDHPETVPGLTALPDDHSDELEPSPREECGVFGVWAPGEDVSRLSYFGLYALQHRGQESAGIATSNGSQILVYKDLGLVSQVFDDQALSNLTGHIAVGHVRYATQGATTWENAQPMLGPAAGSTLALAHNGNLTNTRELMDAVHATSGEDLSGELGRGSSTDTAVLAALLNLVSEHGALEGWDSAADILTSGITDDAELDAAYSTQAPLSVHQAARRVLPMLRGAFSLVFMDEGTLYAARDPHGVRPLVLGRLENGWAVASETAALDIVGATFVREVVKEAGCLLHLDVNNVYVNSCNHGFDPYEYMRQLPLERTCYMHVAGHHVEDDGLIIDTHGMPVIDPVWQLLEFTYDRLVDAGLDPVAIPSCLERDFNFPPLAELVDEVGTIDRMQREASARRAARMQAEAGKAGMEKTGIEVPGSAAAGNGAAGTERGARQDRGVLVP